MLVESIYREVIKVCNYFGKYTVLHKKEGVKM